MKSFLGFVLAVLVLPTTGLEVTPVQKVIELLNGMLEKGKAEKHDEMVQFSTYRQFCDDTTVEKKRSIADNEDKMEMLVADIAKATSDAAKLSREIDGHDEIVSLRSGDKTAAIEVRKGEKTLYDATHKDYSESIDALGRAISVLKKQSHDRKQAALLQVSDLKKLALIPAETKRAINAFIAEGGTAEDALASSAPEANAYEFQSNHIIEMLEKLLDKFSAERLDLETKEANTKHAHQMLVQDLTAEIKQNNKATSEKTIVKAQRLQKKASDTGDLSDTTATRDDDKAYLSNLVSTCDQKATDFESRQKLRAEELVAIQKAMEIISSDDVAGSAEKHLPSFLQARGSSLSHFRADKHGPQQERALQFLRASAHRLDSRVLAALATKVSADPFEKVKRLIKDLIVRLMEEANEEAEHKGWCDTELAENEATRTEKTSVVEGLHAQIDELTASIAKLTEELADHAEEVARMDAAVVKATTIRTEEKEQNMATIKDSKEAQVAVAQALVVLKEFYFKAGKATALLQKQEPPAIFDKPYQGMQSENGGVVGMLEVIESDFARLQAETESAETESQKIHDDFMDETAVSKAQHNKDIEHKTHKKTHQEASLKEAKGDLDGTQKELDAALLYYDKLKPSCVDASVSFDERVGRRKEEVESLKEALRILNGEDM